MPPKTTRPTGFIEFDIIGNERGVQRMLQVIDSALSPVGLASFLYGVGEWVQERAQDRFAAEGDDVTGGWAPLRPATTEIRELAGWGAEHPINRRTGELEAYITQSDIGVTVAPGMGVMRYPNTEPKSPGLRTKVKTAQQGRARPKTVARPVLGLNEKDLGVVITMLAFHVQGYGKKKP